MWTQTFTLKMRGLVLVAHRIWFVLKATNSMVSTQKHTRRAVKWWEGAQHADPSTYPQSKRQACVSPTKDPQIVTPPRSSKARHKRVSYMERGVKQQEPDEQSSGSTSRSSCSSCSETRWDVSARNRRLQFTVCEPGPIGIDLDFNTGCVHKVNPGSQAENLGIRTKMTIKAVDGLPYSEKILRAKVAGDVPFELTWVERMEEEWLEYTSGNDVSLTPSPQRCTPSGAVSSSSVHKCSPPHWDSWEAEILALADHEGHAGVAEKPIVETAENDTSDDPRKELCGFSLLLKESEENFKDFLSATNDMIFRTR